MNNIELNIIQARIGYRFKNIKLLIAAFTHSSYVNEHKAVGNERIEFLGDCVLNFLVGEKLFGQDPTASEGKLSSRRAALVSRAPLARIVDDLGFLGYLQVGKGVNKSGFNDKARSDIFEAVIGAVYLDGGLDACRKLLDDIYYPNVTPERDYKSELQKLTVSSGLPVYSDAQKDGDKFIVSVNVNGNLFMGEGQSKHAAEIAAARTAIEAISQNS